MQHFLQKKNYFSIKLRLFCWWQRSRSIIWWWERNYYYKKK